MDHSALIANTTFRDQQEQIEFRAFAEVQIQQLETIVQDQQNQADAREDEVNGDIELPSDWNLSALASVLVGGRDFPYT